MATKRNGNEGGHYERDRSNWTSKTHMGGGGSESVETASKSLRDLRVAA